MSRPAPKHAARVPFAILVTGLVVGGLVLLLALNTFSAANELRRHDLAARDASIAAQVQQLQVDVADSAAPANLAGAALELGMVPAGNPAFLVIDKDGAVRVMGSAAPATPAVVDIPRPPAAPKTASNEKKKTKKQAGKKKTSTTTGKKKSGQDAKGNAKNRPGEKSTQQTRKKQNKHKADEPQHPTPTPTPTLTLPGGDR